MKDGKDYGSVKEEETAVSSLSDVVDSVGLGFGTIVVGVFAGSFFMIESAQLTMLSFLNPFIQAEWNLSKFETSLPATFAFLGLFFGSFFWGWFSDRFGRKDTIVLCSSITCIFGCLASVSIFFFQLLLCEFFVGFAIGGACVCFSFYVEFLPTKNRGLTLNGVEIFWCIGVIGETALSWFVLTWFEQYQWRFLVLLTVSPCILCVMLAPLMPRSPRFLYVANDPASLESTLKWIERTNCRKRTKNLPRTREKKSTRPIGRLSFSEKVKMFIKDIRYLCTRDFHKQIISFICSKRGIGGIFLYLSIVIFYTAGSFGYYGVALASPNFFSSGNKYFGCFLISLAELPGLALSSLGMWTIGRKATQVLTFLGTGVGLALLLFPRESLTEKIVFGLLTRGSALAATCVTWVIAQESLPTTYRSLGSGFAAAVAKLTTCLSPLVVELFPEHQSFYPKILFALATIFAGVLCIFYPYESKGKDLQDFVEKEVEEVVVFDINSEELERLM